MPEKIRVAPPLLSRQSTQFWWHVPSPFNREKFNIQHIFYSDIQTVAAAAI